MARVEHLQPGDILPGPTTMQPTATFITATPHPLFPGLQLVIWRMDDGTTSLDALAATQEVGQPRAATPETRATALRAALLHPSQTGTR